MPQNTRNIVEVDNQIIDCSRATGDTALFTQNYAHFIVTFGTPYATHVVYTRIPIHMHLHVTDGNTTGMTIVLTNSIIRHDTLRAMRMWMCALSLLY